MMTAAPRAAARGAMGLLLSLCACEAAVESPADSCDDEIVVPAGTFWMGCNSGLDDACQADELPQHLVKTAAFAMDRCEVSVRRYIGCMAEGACAAPHAAGEQCNWQASDRSDHPVNCVDRYQAEAFCAWARTGGRLPSEAEWEKAARGGCEVRGGDCAANMPTFPWGNAAASCALAVMDEGGGPGCGGGGTAPVGSRPEGASPYGLHDMAGNVWEWTWDRYAADWYGRSGAEDPKGPPSGIAFVVRGGRFGGASYQIEHLRSANRDLSQAAFFFAGLGFRCARSPP